MDGAGARTDRGEPTADDGTAGPAHRADHTGPLPVSADPTGPLPAAGSGPWFGPADETGAQPALGAPAPPAWFATGPQPVVPASADTTAWPQVAPPTTPTGPATTTPAGLFDPPADAGPANTGGLFTPGAGTPAASGTPGSRPPTSATTIPPQHGRRAHTGAPGIGARAGASGTTGPTTPDTGESGTEAPTAAHSEATSTRAPTAAPGTWAPTAAPGIQAPTAAHSEATSTRAPTAAHAEAPGTWTPTEAPSTWAPTAAPGTWAPTGAPPAAAAPETRARPAAEATSTGATGTGATDTRATGTRATGTAAPTSAPPPEAPGTRATDTTPPAESPRSPTAPPARGPGRHAAPTGAVPVVPAAPVRPADATGPMPALLPTPRIEPPAPPAPAPPDGPTATGPWPPAAGASSRTGAWSFDPEPAAASPEAWSFAGDDRRGGGGGSAGAQSWPLPAPAGRSHTTTSATGEHGTDVAGAARARRSRWPLLILGMALAVGAGVALVFAFARAQPADLVASAGDAAAGWPGVHYRGAVAALDGGEITFDLTVTPDGATGTLTREGGRAGAEVLHDGSGTLLRADREWWLYRQPARADDLAGTWVAEPLTETQEIDRLLQLTPAALADHLRSEPAGRWEALEQQLVDGRTGVVLSDGSRRLVVGDAEPHVPLTVDVLPGTEARVVAANGREAAAVTGAAAAVRQESAPRTLTQFLLERPVVEIQLQPEPLCTAPACRVSVTVTNSGTAPARGRLEVSADGQVVANHPLDVAPGQGATFEASAPNPQFSQPGSSGQILWESRAVDE